MPLSGCSSPGDHPEERRLAGAVRADHADDAAGRQREGEALDEELVAEALRDVLRLDDDVPEPRAGGDVDLHPVELDVAILGEQALVGAEPRLGFRVAGPGRRPDPLELSRQSAAARRLLLLLRREPRLLLLEPGRVVALERDAPAAVELEDPAGHVVEEVAVVRDRHHRALVVVEEALQPGDGLGVEMVGRLVQEQQVG